MEMQKIRNKHVGSTWRILSDIAYYFSRSERERKHLGFYFQVGS
jgi:hypothetical protein